MAQMRISRLVVKNFRSLKRADLRIDDGLCCLIGENNTGKSAAMRAIQLCIDNSLPSSFRFLTREDIYSGVDISKPRQVLIGVELEDFQGKVNEESLVATWKIGPNRARIFYRFRPKLSVREKLAAGDLKPGDLTLQDYNWEIRGGGDPAIDLLDIRWSDDGIGEAVRFADLQSYLVLSLSALRDVEADLRSTRTSPLVRLIEAFEIEKAEQQSLIAILDKANKDIESAPTIKSISKSVDTALKYVSGPAFEMDANLGLSAATFQSILRNIKILLSDHGLASFEPSRNGLGMNNILYIATLLEAMKKRIQSGSSAGQVILIEEPEAHLHPQLQISLLNALREYGTQIILTSHSTHITSQAPFSSFVSLTRRADDTVSAKTLSKNPALEGGDVADLERYLDATKSNLLFARKVMLVEGPAEQFLIPALAKSTKNINLDRLGISVVAIHGVHFDVYAKLFSEDSLEKRCAIVADADLKPSDADDDFDPSTDAPDVFALKNDFVEVFLGKTTFERELVLPGTLDMLIATVAEFSAPKALAALKAGKIKLSQTTTPATERRTILNDLGERVLRTAKRFGKARFAQVAARHAHLCSEMPEYISEAIDWLIE